MKYDVLVRPEAEDDLKAAFLWYENNRVGLGHDFLLQVDIGFNCIRKNPEVNPVEYKGARKRLIKRFPYKIVYCIKETKIIVLAVIHGKRNPELLKIRANAK